MHRHVGYHAKEAKKLNQREFLGFMNAIYSFSRVNIFMKKSTL